MRKIFKTAVATIATAAMAVTLMAGYVAPANAAVVNTLDGVDWQHNFLSWEANDAVILNSYATNTSNGWISNISITGWQRQWEGVNQPEDAIAVGGGWSDNPYQIYSSAVASVAAGTEYELKFTITNNMKTATGVDSAKNVTISVGSGIAGDNDNTWIFETVTVPANGTYEYEKKFTIPADYSVGAVEVKLGYGAYAYSMELTNAVANGAVTEEQAQAMAAANYAYAYGTTEEVNLTGTLTFGGVELNGEEAPEVDTSQKPIVIPGAQETTPSLGNNQQVTTAAPTTAAPTVAPTVAPTTKAKVKKPAKVKVKKATNLKGKKVKITWKKVKGAKKYQVMVGTKKKTTKKLQLTIKVAKKKTYKVRVRAYNAAGYGKWSTAKKVKVTK